MATPLDDVAAALVAAEKYAADLTAERDALLTRVNELDDEVARLVQWQSVAAGLLDDAARSIRCGEGLACNYARSPLPRKAWCSACQWHDRYSALPAEDEVTPTHPKGGDAHAPGGRPAPRHLQVTSPAPDSTSAAGVGGAPLAATAAALELVAECWNGLNEGIGVTFDGLLRAKARELREGK